MPEFKFAVGDRVTINERYIDYGSEEFPPAAIDIAIVGESGFVTELPKVSRDGNSIDFPYYQVNLDDSGYAWIDEVEMDISE
jgi:hypothetical protein